MSEGPSISVEALPTRTGLSLRIVCFSPQSWEVELPTNRQQIMTRLIRLGHRVLFVETGAFVGRSLARSPRAAARSILSPRKIGDRLQVMTAPNLLPWGHRFSIAARVNAQLTTRAIRRQLRSESEPVIAWFYDPCFADCIGALGERFAVYDCVDDYAEQSGSDERKRAFITKCDRDVARRARLVFVTATPLLDRHKAVNPATHLVRNVGEYLHFAGAADRSLVAAELRHVPSPVIGFVGNFLKEKVDFDVLRTLVGSRPDWSIVLVGPANPETQGEVADLVAHENVTWLGGRPYDELPGLVAAFDVAVIPYCTNAYTRSVFPLKTFEYLAAGKPVIATGLPELAGLEPHVIVAGDAVAFVDAVAQALERRSPEDIASRQRLAADNTWETRTQHLLDLIAEELEAGQTA